MGAASRSPGSTRTSTGPRTAWGRASSARWRAGWDGADPTSGRRDSLTGLSAGRRAVTCMWRIRGMPSS
eukprot:8002488-Alexandrium_andersonii.AAC.1